MPVDPIHPLAPPARTPPTVMPATRVRRVTREGRREESREERREDGRRRGGRDGTRRDAPAAHTGAETDGGIATPQPPAAGSRIDVRA